MRGIGFHKRWVLASGLWAALAGPTFAQTIHTPKSANANAPAVELFYGVKPVSRTSTAAQAVRVVPQPSLRMRTAPLVMPPIRLVPPVPPPPVPPLTVIPAIARTSTPVPSPTVAILPQVVIDAASKLFQRFRERSNDLTEAAKEILQILNQPVAAPVVIRTPAAKPVTVLPDPVPVPRSATVLATPVVEAKVPPGKAATLPPMVESKPLGETAPGPLPILSNVLPLPHSTPLVVPVAPELPRPEPVAVNLPVAKKTEEITLTQDRLISALGVAIGVAVALAIALFAVLMLRRPRKPVKLELPPWVPTVTGPTPLVVSEVGLPKVPETVSSSRPEDVLDSYAMPLRTPLTPNRFRNEEAVVQFILDQNLAVLSAIGPSRSQDMSMVSNMAIPIH